MLIFDNYSNNFVDEFTKSLYYDKINNMDIYLKRNEEKNIKGGYGFVYANEVYKVEGKEKNGSLVTVRSFDGKFIGKGYINFLSKILVRIFLYNENFSDEEVIARRIEDCKKFKESLGLGETYRAVYAEADLLPGLIVDKYADVLSVQFLTLGMDKRKDFIISCLVKTFSPSTIIERSDVSVREKEGLPLTKGIIYGKDIKSVIVTENDIKIKVDLIDGQKTGYFLDQKQNRFAIRRYCKDKTVLDCFTNAGGFALNAALAGAKMAYALDISQTAVDEVNFNASLNNFNNITAICCDVFEKLREYKAEGQKFDVIILDPPAFTKSSDNVTSALKGYKDINILAMKLLNKNGILVSSSCSHFVTNQMFLKMLEESSNEAGKIAKVLEMHSQACDHPYLLSAKETAYLKFFILQIS